MLDYIETVKQFILDNFCPGNPENANVKLTTEMLLGFLFRTFPEHCVSDYELNDILIELGYFRYTYVVEQHSEKKKKKETTYEVKKSLEVGWCLKSYHDLRTETIPKK